MSSCSIRRQLDAEFYLFCLKNERELWLFGLGRSGLYLSDFGGGREIVGGALETCLRCCLLEVSEETNGLLTLPILSSLGQDPKVYQIDKNGQNLT